MNKDTAIRVVTTSVTYTTAALLFVSLNAAAAGLPQYFNRIESNSLNNVSGIISVNMAAGDNNIQANNKSIAIGKHAQATTKTELVVHGSNNNSLKGNDNSVADVRIEANTLQNAQGLISINQVSGSNNAQLNDMTLAFGENVQLASNISLSVRPAEGPNFKDNEGSHSKAFYLDKDSLKGAAGTIQINQIAGNGNIAVNRVSMPKTNKAPQVTTLKISVTKTMLISLMAQLAA